ncbi:hypothetical protein [Desulfogranum japonicum]|uniref:hypothetical protein n=1 Tax=Desulfogranum japonicum TaxID=231447 RepID=UPI0003FDBFE9|nr:hypothetical protein [Desulfogranum japonicum]
MGNATQLKTRGTLMLISFFIILAAIFMPLFPGPTGKKVNGLVYLDNFFNQLSKGSAYYIDKQIEAAKEYAGTPFEYTLVMKSSQQAALADTLLKKHQITTSMDGVYVKVTGDFSQIMTTILNDADIMYQNNGQAISEMYGVNELEALYGWYQVLDAMAVQLNKAQAFGQAKFVKNSMTKAVEPSYNYYKVEVKPVREEMVLLAFALVFYVAYTVWYGFGLLFIFEGMGIKLEH